MLCVVQGYLALNGKISYSLNRFVYACFNDILTIKYVHNKCIPYTREF